MKKSFQRTCLGELLNFFNGKAPLFDDEGDFPVYGSNGVIGRSKTSNYENAIILGRVGAYCGSVARCRGKFWASDNTIVAGAKEGCDIDFGYYLLGVTPLNSFAGGAAQPLITHKILRPIEVAVPTKTIQKRIASMLSDYDNLIENNRRRVALLEEAARLLYREWFVRLRFPGHKHTLITKGVPEGWERKTIGDICTEIRETVSPKDLEPDTPYIGLEHMPRRSISLTEWSTAETVTSTKHRYREGDILFAKIRPYFHKVGIAFTDGVASSDAIMIRPNSDDLRSLVLMTVSSDNFVAEASQTMREGSKMPRADWKLMTKYPVALPPKGFLENFEKTVTAITDQLRNLCFQKQKLKAARDLLLPRLMSGEIAL